MIIAIAAISFCLVICLIVLVYVVFKQTVILNNVIVGLMTSVEDATEGERRAKEDLNAALEEKEMPFNPHDYGDDDPGGM